mmetsp:Transcript_5382/g.5785  ORF Transcript_5382/g.5785 Transcript_5382/m.5785 type:complete len:701 (+) Transcript_5382:576-2678(+)
MTKMKDGILESNVVITEAIIDGKKSTLSQKLTELGYKYNDDDVLNSSFADSSFTGSVANDSLFDDDANNCLNINNDTADDGSDEGHYSVQSETSAGEHSNGSLTDDLDKSVENSRRVRFDETPLFRTISPRASRNVSKSASTSIPRTNRRSNPSRSTQKTTRRTTRNSTNKQVTTRSPSSSPTQPSQSRRRGSVCNRRQSLSSAAPAAIRVPVAAADEKLLLQITLTLMSLPTGVRVYILNLLDPESLKELTLVSKQLHQECNGLGIENPIIPVFQLSPLGDNYCGLFGACMCVSKQNFLQNISHYRLDEETYRILQRYRQMEVKDFDKFGYVIGHVLLRKVMNSTIQMQGIVLLNISLPKQRQQRLPLFYQPLTTCSLAIALSRIVPNLLELDLSNTPSSGTILQNFSVHCPLLEKITCNNNNNIYADGSEIQWATNLNEIVMDNCIVSYLKPIVTANNNDNDNNNQGISADPDSLPQNPTETLLLSQLSQMGFGRQEILDGIRQSENENPTTDEIMMLLIERREEAEEARRMDEVRLRSEEQTQGEINRREQTVQDSIASATTGEDLMIIFPESWVLKVLMDDGHDDSRDITKNPNGRHQRLISTIMNESRNDFVEFLQLEKKARKWYGFVLPSDYFNKVGTRLKNEPQIDWLGAEREKLRCGLYELKEQEKGEPKIFSDVYKTGISNKKEIIVIDDD